MIKIKKFQLHRRKDLFQKNVSSHLKKHNLHILFSIISSNPDIESSYHRHFSDREILPNMSHFVNSCVNTPHSRPSTRVKNGRAICKNAPLITPRLQIFQTMSDRVFFERWVMLARIDSREKRWLSPQLALHKYARDSISLFCLLYRKRPPRTKLLDVSIFANFPENTPINEPIRRLFLWGEKKGTTSPNFSFKWKTRVGMIR